MGKEFSPSNPGRVKPAHSNGLIICIKPGPDLAQILICTGKAECTCTDGTSVEGAEKSVVDAAAMAAAAAEAAAAAVWLLPLPTGRPLFAGVGAVPPIRSFASLVLFSAFVRFTPVRVFAALSLQFGFRRFTIAALRFKSASVAVVSLLYFFLWCISDYPVFSSFRPS
ncbi:hypothetical protein DM860_013474 [Cuscuta australis]|uniref:Uncharacterized protein n=1 Tax=Cuscuta australis TaxID=267555 RepID=A0A328D4F2_9ASTE|nr:hypothetical protein DM860_013474 [Cuscuta australis]